MPIRSNRRHFLQVTMQADLYHQVKEHCKALDKPVTVWVRDLICKELEGNHV
jgi:hypothetical protein